MMVDGHLGSGEEVSISTKPPLAVDAYAVSPRAKRSGYPEPFFSRMSRREKRQLGDDLCAELDADGAWRYLRKDGSAY